LINGREQIRRMDMESEYSSQRFVSGVISFLVGGLVGAGVGMLLAPKTGREMREQIRGTAKDAKEATGDYYERLKKTVVSTLENGRELLEEKKDLIASAVRAGIETYEKGKKEGRSPSVTVEPSPY
jgi:gas vesicle protein